MAVLTVDFGSTFTKLTAIDESERKILGTARAFTTIESDIREGFNTALKELESTIGRIEYTEKFAASSAGGGLKMVAVGLVPDLTAKAARLAANNAGAKVIKTYSYELSEVECDEIFNISPDIILLCGGTDGGNKEVIIHNARQISGIDGDFSVVVAGNKAAGSTVMDTLKSRSAVLTSNVMPSFGKLDITPAKTAICELFIKRIIAAKGIDRAQRMMNSDIIPTPLAVFEGAELLSKKLNDLMVIDVGGATTDVYSMADGLPTRANTVVKGLTEPFAKRSVEGDLGLRYGMATLIEAATAERAAVLAGVSADVVCAWRDRCKSSPGVVPEAGEERRIDDALAALAVELAFVRHCGTLESVYTPAGEAFMQEGKDLTGIKYIVGVGGPVIGAGDPAAVLQHSCTTNPFALTPVEPRLLIDKRYIFAAMGLLGRTHPELALELMVKNFEEV